MLNVRQTPGTAAAQPIGRWVYVHMIEEHTRHNGHSDLLHERIDGATRYQPAHHPGLAITIESHSDA
jgi:Protein of unknown function (DUF664)